MNRSELQKLLFRASLFLVTAVSMLALMCLLPHDRYIRWQSVRSEAYARLGWVYERIHFDPTPVDIAFVGTSHTMNGVDAGAVEADIAGTGDRTADGRCYTATNFAIPSYGRNLQWLVARELIQHRKLKVLVLEVVENESRKAHPLFVHVADARDVVEAPALINLNYLPDLSRLPFRQASLWFETLLPSLFHLKKSFDINDYDGSTVDNTRVVNVGGVALSPPLTRQLPPAELAAAARQNASTKNLHMLPPSLERLEYNFPLHYLNGILDLARKNGVEVVFLYLPGYGQPPRPYDMRPYAGHGDMVFVNDILSEVGNWHDVNHLNTMGAHSLSQRLGAVLGQRLHTATTPITAAACNFGLPPRALLRPFHSSKHTGPAGSSIADPKAAGD